MKDDSFTKVGTKRGDIYFRIHLRLAFLVVSCFLEISLNSLTRERMCECYFSFFLAGFDTVGRAIERMLRTRGLKFCQNFAPPALVLI